MNCEKHEESREMVLSLAETLQKKIVGPATEKTEAINREIQKIHELIDGLEQKHLLLAAKHRRTRILAVLGCLLIITLLAVQIINFWGKA